MRRHPSDDEERLLSDTLAPEQEKPKWDHFKTVPREINTGSMADQHMFVIGEQIMKMVTFIVTFVVVLTGAVISKGTLLFMTSQISNHTTPYCNTLLSKNKQFVVTLPRIERMQWMWMLLFAYFVPQAGIFIRSLRICMFKKWRLPTFLDFLSVMITETLPAIGSAILVYSILPELDVIKGAMLTNAVCFVPAVVGFLCRSSNCPPNSLYVILDIISIVAQASSFVVWPLIEGKPVLWLIPVSVIFISFGYWENYVSDESPIGFIQRMARAKKVFEGSRYFTYVFVSLWKCLMFFTTMVVIVFIQEGEVNFMFANFHEAFSKHQIFVDEIKPIIGSANIPNITELISISKGTFIDSDHLIPIWVWLINIGATYITYVFGKFACKVLIQEFSYAFPINLAMPVALSALIAVSGVYVRDECFFKDTIPFYLFFKVPPVYFLKDFLGNQQSWIWLIWLLSQTWITVHIWNPTCERLERTERLYVRPMYDAFLIDQDIALNRRRDDYVIPEIKDKESGEVITSEEYASDRIPKVYACGTMWHEEEAEMVEFLKSIFRLDADQCARRLSRDYWTPITDYYELETHILFDNAFVRYEMVPDPNHPENIVESDPYINDWVKKLIVSVNKAATNVHGVEMELNPPQKSPTPYGGKLIWTLPGNTKMIAHLKDAKRIRTKKRWSQVMYMYYLLGHKLFERRDIGPTRADVIAENTFILALDGDIDFQPSAVLLLINLMKKNKSLGAACGRIHPIGSGPMVWYQMFEYAVGHWLQKATEHMIGCVLCSPGCFSLFRGKALMDDNVMNKYTTKSTEAQHYVQFDQGEDRWLCTLLLQRGYRVEYSAASDAYTHCPESFNEFYNQRRRWMPSTTANILDLLMDYKHVIKMNENISILYIGYQVVLMVGTVLGPGTIFLMLVGAFVAAFQMDQWSSFLWNAVPILFFMLICKLFEKDTIQLFFAAVISAMYGLVMMAVLVGVMLQISNDGPLAPSSLFFFCVAGEMIITAFLHPKEINCLPYGIIYYVTVPSMYMLLVIYSIFNMNNVSWGTRDVVIVPKMMEENSDDEAEEPKIEEKKTISRKDRVLNILGRGDESNGSFICSFAGLFKCLWCTVSQPTEEQMKLNEIKANVDTIMKRLDQISRGVIHEEEPKAATVEKRETIILEGENATEKYRLMNCTVKNGKITREEYPDSWLDDEVLQKCETVFSTNEEEDFWKLLLQKYLAPILPNKAREDEVAKNLINLRDKSVGAFFMLNSLFVLVVFLLTLKKELLHIKWPFDVKSNFTYNNDQNQIRLTKEYLQLEPIGLVFLVFFALLLVVQFIAMLFHRFNTFCQIMSNTTLDFSWLRGKNSGSRMEVTNPIDAIKQLQSPRDDEEDEKEEMAGRRTTVANLMQKAAKPKKMNKDLTDNFIRRATQLQLGKYKGKMHEAIAAEVRRNTVLDPRRKTIMKKPNLEDIPGAKINLGFVGDTNT